MNYIMIEISITKGNDSHHYINGIRVSGHAVEKGKNGLEADMVCAAISALSQTLYYGITDELSYHTKIESSSGYFQLRMITCPDDKTQLLFRTCIRGIREIDKEYPGHIHVNW